MRVLVAEDEPKMAAVLERGLEEEGYAVDVTRDGIDAEWMASENEYDCIVLDVMLPGIDGVQVCRRLRESEVWSPIVMVTARDAIADRVRGLDAGADDYVVKPFSFDELLARVRALTRRRPGERPAVLQVADLVVDPATREVSRAGVPISLTPKEFALLEYLMEHHDEVVSRTRIIEHVWDWSFEGLSNVVDVYVRYLRNKIDRPFDVPLLHTVRGAGYVLGKR
jgi:two-component system, OmpR family, response regulator